MGEKQWIETEWILTENNTAQTLSSHKHNLKSAIHMIVSLLHRWQTLHDCDVWKCY